MIKNVYNELTDKQKYLLKFVEQLSPQLCFPAYLALKLKKSRAIVSEDLFALIQFKLLSKVRNGNRMFYFTTQLGKEMLADAKDAKNSK